MRSQGTQDAQIALVCSSGGHLAQMRKIFTPDMLEGHSHVWITERVSKDKAKDAQSAENGEERVIYFRPLKLNPIKNFIAMVRLVRIFRRMRTKVVITTGADMGSMAMLAGKIAGARTIFIETVIRVKRPTLTGLVAYPFSDIFLVQHRGLEKKIGKKAMYKGGIL